MLIERGQADKLDADLPSVVRDHQPVPRPLVDQPQPLRVERTVDAMVIVHDVEAVQDDQLVPHVRAKKDGVVLLQLLELWVLNQELEVVGVFRLSEIDRGDTT